MPDYVEADFLAFAAPQDEQAGVAGGKPATMGNLPELSHVTAAPPVPDFQSMQKVSQGTFYTRRWLEDNGAHIVESAVDLSSHRPKVVLGLQCAPNNANVSTLRKQGIRILALAYSGRNQYGSGYNDPEGGLTDAGRELILACDQHDVIIDFSHLNHRTARDVIEFIEQKALPRAVCATHGGCFALADNPRNLPDDVLGWLGENKGLVGVATITFMLHETDDSMEPFYRHLEHMLEVCGPRAVCLGTDGVYRDMTREEARAVYGRLTAMLQLTGGAFEPRFPDRPEELIRNGATQLNLIEQGLRQRGFENIEGIMGQNLRRFLSHKLI